MDSQGNQSSGPDSRAPSDRWSDGFDAKPHPATEAFAHLRGHFDELLAYINHYATAKADAVKVAVRKTLLMVALGAIGAAAATAILITACVMLLGGIAQAISAAAGRGPWLGNLVVGVVVIGGVALTVWIGVRKFTGTTRKQLVEHYERRQKQQRGDFGYDAHERAEQAEYRE